MMPQFIQNDAHCDELSLAQAELDHYILSQADQIAPLDNSTALGGATQKILDYSFFLSAQKTRSKTEYKQLLNNLGWKGEERKYLKVATAFKKFSPLELAALEPGTIFQLANNSQKYQSVIDSLFNLPQITQGTVRKLIQQQRKPREAKSQNLSIWRHTESGSRYCQIPPIHESDDQTGIILQRAMDEKGLLPQAIMREAMELWQAYHEGRLVAVESSGATSADSLEVVENCVECGEESAIALPISKQLVAMELDLLEEQLSIATGESGCEVVESGVECGEESAIRMCAVAKSIALPTSLEQIQPESTELCGTQILIHAFQNSANWFEISPLLKIHHEYKQLAWKALTHTEKQRVLAIIPEDIKKFNSAKKSGIIIDFQEVRQNVYQVQCQGSLFWEVVSSARLDAFLVEL